MAQRVAEEGTKPGLRHHECAKCEDNGWIFVKTSQDASREKKNTCVPCQDCNGRAYERWSTGEIFRDARNNDQSRRAEPRQTVQRRQWDDAYIEDRERQHRRDLA
jgi:hypothetical protein